MPWTSAPGTRSVSAASIACSMAESAEIGQKPRRIHEAELTAKVAQRNGQRHACPAPAKLAFNRIAGRLKRLADSTGAAMFDEGRHKLRKAGSRLS